MRLRLLVNPAAGRGAGARHLPRLAGLAAEHGIAPPRVSAGADDLTREARCAVGEGIERLLVAGGDGTAHHAVQGLAGSGCALGLVPLGSGNDLAGTLGLPRSLPEAFRRAATGPLRRIDLLRAGGRVAVGYVGLGLDAEVARRAAAPPGARPGLVRGPLIYPWAVLSTLFSFAPPRLRVAWEGGAFEGAAMFAVCANLPRFGGGMRIAPDARIDDGLLDLVIVRAVPRRTLLAVFPKVYRGRHVGHPAVTIARTPWAEIAADRAVEIYGGGEPMHRLAPVEPVRVEVVPGGLAVAG
ncbi:MAG TPA: diacylglycerol kinase family protein [Thermoanaerobaculia bacterium]|nr:diacylglycerol kinase family protein [Thermoanaerobaculia bacterium]